MSKCISGVALLALALFGNPQHALTGESQTQPAPASELGQPRELRVVSAHVWAVVGLAFSPDGRTLASSAGDGTIRLWDVGTGKLLKQRFVPERATAYKLVFSSEGKTLACPLSDFRIATWTVGEALVFREVARCHTLVTELALFPDGRRMAVGGADGVVRILRTSTGEELRQLKGHETYVLTVDVSADGTRLLSAGGHTGTTGDDMPFAVDCGLHLWEIGSGREVAVLTGHDRPVNSVRFSPDGNYALSGSGGDKTMRLWDLNSKRQVRRFTHPAAVWSVAFSPDGRLAVCGTRLVLARDIRNTNRRKDCAVWVWSIKTGKLLRVYRGHEGSVLVVAVSPCGKYVASGGVDGTVRLWPLPRAGDKGPSRAQATSKSARQPG
jgi:WD40 repeat protein